MLTLSPHFTRVQQDGTPSVECKRVLVSIYKFHSILVFSAENGRGWNVHAEQRGGRAVNEYISLTLKLMASLHFTSFPDEGYVRPRRFQIPVCTVYSDE